MARLSPILLIGLAAAALLLLSAQQHPTPVPPPPDTIPLIQVDASESLTLQQFSGKTILVHFLNSRCLPCLYEFPRMIALAQRHPEQVVLLAVSNDATAHKAYEYAHGFCIRHMSGNANGRKLFEQPGNIHVIWDQDNRIAQAMSATGHLPETIVLAPELTTLRHIEGPLAAADWDFLEQQLNR